MDPRMNIYTVFIMIVQITRTLSDIVGTGHGTYLEGKTTCLDKHGHLPFLLTDNDKRDLVNMLIILNVSSSWLAARRTRQKEWYTLTNQKWEGPIHYASSPLYCVRALIEADNPKLYACNCATNLNSICFKIGGNGSETINPVCNQKTWHSAYKQCRGLGGRLADVEDMRVSSFSSWCRRNMEYWVGIYSPRWFWELPSLGKQPIDPEIEKEWGIDHHGQYCVALSTNGTVRFLSCQSSNHYLCLNGNWTTETIMGKQTLFLVIGISISCLGIAVAVITLGIRLCGKSVKEDETDDNVYVVEYNTCALSARGGLNTWRCGDSKDGNSSSENVYEDIDE